jgi:Glycosyl transferase family 2
MISLRRTFLPKLFLLIVFLFCILFYIRSLNGNSNSILSVEKTKISSNNLPQQQSLVQNFVADQLQEPENINIDDNNNNNFNNNRNKLVIDNEIVDENVKTTKSKKINKYELEIQRDLKKQQEDPDLGADGKIAHLKDPDDIEMGEKQLAKIALNEELSNHISYNRTLLDSRHPACRKKTYDISLLESTKASVIIIFFNEPYSVLIRTVHSTINTSPPSLLKEVILVDDGSSNIELKHKLDYYVKTRFSDKVKVLRLKNR